MTFLLPWAWLWLLALVPVLVLYFLRRRERDWPVSALFLWEGVRPDRPRWVERLRARFDVLLLLQVLGVVLSALALSRPGREVLRPAGATLLVLDASAPTAAEGTRERILAAAEEVLRNSAGPWAAVLWAEPPEVLVPPTADPERALALLRRYAPRLTRRPELARALALLPEPWPRVVVLTDDPTGIAGAEVIAVPRPENLGITAFAVRPSPDGLRYEAFLRVLNATSGYKDVQIRIVSEAGEFWAARLVPPGEEEEVVLVLPGARAGAFVAELRPSDAFAWDNVRYFVLRGGEVRVAWRGPEDRYLWAALRAAAPLRRDEKDPDLFVAVGTALPGEPAGPCLLVGAGLPGAAVVGPAEAGPLRAEASPLLENLSLRAWRLGQVLRQEVPPTAQVLLWAGEVPLLFLWETPAGRRAALALDLARTNLPLLPDFPILVRHLLAWLLPQEPAAGALVGEAVVLPPGFSMRTEEGTFTGVWVPTRPGIYALDGPRGPQPLAVNVPWEAFRPGEAAGEGERPVRPARALQPLWPWAALALVLLLGAEAVLFLRREG
ncbi:MAG: VWA domain-containing protein [Candidatus Bipolaricaulota bacterium]|nr:VWA domain-containing protein [Candidatus Bipolaricaulota bacterium]MDW8152103.1 VWA domain-containing protein [Candidatus Bipolaricaulota bacterium]